MDEDIERLTEAAGNLLTCDCIDCVASEVYSLIDDNSAQAIIRFVQTQNDLLQEGHYMEVYHQNRKMEEIMRSCTF